MRKMSFCGSSPDIRDSKSRQTYDPFARAFLVYVCIEGGRRERGKRGAREGGKKEKKEGWTVENFGNKKVSRNMGVEVRPFMGGREGDFSFEKTGEE